VSPPSPPDLATGHLQATESPFRLSVRTSMLSEFRDTSGALGAFELSRRFTTAGALRSALSQLPGIRFESEPVSLWSLDRNRFTFKSRVFEISIPFEDIRVAPVEADAVYGETEELLRMLTESLLPKWQNRSRSRYLSS
jgi:hypothetical protein